MDDQKHPHEQNFNVSSFDVLLALYLTESIGFICSSLENISLQRAILLFLMIPMFVGSGLYIYWSIEVDRLNEINKSAITSPARRKDEEQ
jgi:hypothetical protein